MQRARALCAVLSASAFLAACATPPRPAPGAGCWANAYAEPGYRGALTTYTGPSYARHSLKDAASLAIGPGARLEGFSDASLEHATLTLGPGTRVPDLRGRAVQRRVAAFELACVG